MTELDNPVQRGTRALQQDKSCVYIVSKYVKVEQGSTSADLELNKHPSCDGLSVRATLSWSKYGDNAVPSTATIEWEAQELGAKNVSISFDASALKVPEDDVIVVEVVRVSTGYVDKQEARATVGLLDEDGIPGYEIVEQAIFYRWEMPYVTINLVNGTVKGVQDAMVQYSLEPVEDAEMSLYFPGVLPKNGIVRFAPGESKKKILLEVDWQKVPTKARHSVAMKIIPVYKARISRYGPRIAAHLLGSEKGSCPPGSKVRDGEEKTTGQPISKVDTRDLSIRSSNASLVLVREDGSSIPLYSRVSAPNQDLGAVVDTKTERIYVCLPPVLRLHPSKQDTSRLLGPVRNQHCGKDVEEFRVSLPIGLSSYLIVGEKSHNATISIRRQADFRHTQLEYLKIVPSHGAAFFACQAPEPIVTIKNVEAARKAGEVNETNTCVAGNVLKVNLDSDVDSVQIVPSLLVQNIPGVRLEMNGQVVGYSGTPDDSRQRSDAEPFDATSSGDSQGYFMSDAYIMNLPIAVEVPVQIVVFAEDGTTTSSYSLMLHRKNSKYKSQVAASNAELSRIPALASILVGDMSNCDVCMPGWVSTAQDAIECSLCPPGSFADKYGTKCELCDLGTYSMSWGSRQCKHCIEGTYASRPGSTSCKLCPDTLTTNGDGKSMCQANSEDKRMQNRYAVMIYVSVKLSGIDEDAIILKAGVQDTPHKVISNLVKADVASAFNTSTSAVRVMSIRKLSDRNYETNVSASLPVYIPPSATEEDITTALELERLSADSPLELLATNPDTFFGKTTEILEAHVESTAVHTEDYFPSSTSGLMIGLVTVGSIGTLMGMLLFIHSAHRLKQRPGEREALLGGRR
jgi:hypothetical protein